jgi:hypothetical protein
MFSKTSSPMMVSERNANNDFILITNKNTFVWLALAIVLN